MFCITTRLNGHSLLSKVHQQLQGWETFTAYSYLPIIRTHPILHTVLISGRSYTVICYYFTALSITAIPWDMGYPRYAPPRYATPQTCHYVLCHYNFRHTKFNNLFTPSYSISYFVKKKSRYADFSLCSDFW